MQFHKSIVQRMIRGPDGKISKISVVKQHNGKKGIIYINKNGKKEVKSFKIRCKPKRKTQNKKVSKLNKTKKRKKNRKKNRKNKINSLNNAGNIRKSLFKKKKKTTKNKRKNKRKSKKRGNSKGFWHNFLGV